MSPVSDPRIGTRLAGYQIEALVGWGGMGVVYRAEDPRLGRRVALKVLPAESAEDERFRARFLEESRLAASIEHPHIIPVHEAGEAGGVLYIAMRYVEGTDLGTLLDREGKLTPARALGIAIQIASALDAAHARGLVHRDVKPSNILVAPGAQAGEEHAYLCDFGVSKRASAMGGLTQTGQFLGTADYVAPEQIEGRPTDGRADVYALGAVVFKSLTGVAPYERETEYGVLWAKLHQPPPSATVILPELPAGVDGVLAAALARRREDRYSTCGELIAALRAELGETGQEPRSVPRREPGLEDHQRTVVKAMLEGRLVPLLGTDIHLSGPEGAGRDESGSPLPLPADITARLAESFGYPAEGVRELVRVSQFVAIMEGSGPLYDKLHELFDADHPPGPLHSFLAWVPSVLRERGAPQPLIVTTSYDLALERAFDDAGEPFDVVTYIALGKDRGKFLHLGAEGRATVIDTPNAYAELSLHERPIILKLHGQVDRSAKRDWESFVVTEDDHIEYLAQTDISSLIPVTLAAALRRSHFLFFGFRLQDWNLRAALHRVWGDRTVNYKSWAIQPGASAFEREFWRHRAVDLLDISSEEYVAALRERLSTLGVSMPVP